LRCGGGDGRVGVLPKHANSDRDLAFTVMGRNFLSTVVMVIYPTLQPMLGYSLHEMGVFLGGAIHDVAQVAGAGQPWAPSPDRGHHHQLLRVAFLLPAIAGIAWWSPKGARRRAMRGRRRRCSCSASWRLAALNSVGVVPPTVKAAVADIRRS